MRFRLLSLCAVLLAATQAAPTTADLQARKSINDCGFSTFENQSTDGSPLIADCEKIVSNIARGGSWTIGNGGSGHYQLVSFGTCAWGVNTEDSMSVSYIGNQDIIDTINESIKRFRFKDVVGARGVMPCTNATMRWSLYRKTQKTDKSDKKE